MHTADMVAGQLSGFRTSGRARHLKGAGRPNLDRLSIASFSPAADSYSPWTCWHQSGRQPHSVHRRRPDRRRRPKTSGRWRASCKRRGGGARPAEAWNPPPTLRRVGPRLPPRRPIHRRPTTSPERKMPRMPLWVPAGRWGASLRPGEPSWARVGARRELCGAGSVEGGLMAIVHFLRSCRPSAHSTYYLRSY